MLIIFLWHAREQPKFDSPVSVLQHYVLFKVAEQLKFDLSHVLTTKIDFINNPVYHDNIILEDNIRSNVYEYYTLPETLLHSYI